MTTKEKARRRAIVENLVKNICKIYETEEIENKANAAPESIEEANTSVGKDDYAGQIKSVKLGFEGQSVPVSSFKSAEDLLKAIYDLSQKAGEEGYYESLQVDFDYDGNGGYEVSFFEMDD